MRPIPLTNARIDFLKSTLPRIDFFALMPREQLDGLMPFVIAQEFDPAERVFEQGDAGDAFYVIFRGSVAVEKKKGFFSATQRVDLEIGNYFGEIALVQKVPRTASVVCREQTELLVLRAVDFESVLEENPAVAELIARVAAERNL